jgi:hypothetical protein
MRNHQKLLCHFLYFEGLSKWFLTSKAYESEEMGLVELDLQGVLVQVDYTSIVCKIV